MTRRQPALIAALAALLAVGLVLAAQSGVFNVTLTINNDAPIVYWVNSSFSLTPVENATGQYQFVFNVSDSNGAVDLNDSTATVTVALGSQTATSTACTPNDSGTTVTYNCSIGLPYYYNASAGWVINASVVDNSGVFAQNTSQTFTYNTLKAIKLQRASLSFNGSGGQNDVAATEGAQVVYNTGNYDFTHMNLTAYDLVGGSNYVGAGNFTVNVSDSGGAGQSLQNASAVNVTGSDFLHGNGATETLYVYLDIPQGLPSDTYTASSNWIVDAN